MGREEDLTLKENGNACASDISNALRNTWKGESETSSSLVIGFLFVVETTHNVF